MALRDTSIIWKITISLQVLGLILTLAGFGSNYIGYWETGDSSISYGLWKYCYDYPTGSGCQDTNDILTYHKKSGVWLDASKAMMSMSVVAQFLAIILTGFSALVAATKLMMWAIAAVAMFSALPGVIGVSVAIGEGKSVFKETTSLVFDVAWSFTLFMIGQGIFLVSGVLHIIDARGKESGRASQEPPKPPIIM